MKRSLYPNLLLAPDSAAGAVAAPPAPASAEAAPPTRPSGAAPAAAPEKIDNKPDAEADIFSELDNLSKPAAPEKPAKPAEKPADAKKPAEPEKPAEPAKPEEHNLNTPKGLRIHADKLKAENNTLREQIKSFERRIQEGEAKGKDMSALTERVASLEKEREAIQAELAGYKQEASPEFVAKYHKPFDDAAEYAKTQVSAMEVVAKVDEEGNPVEMRQADWNKDFGAIYARAKTNPTEAMKMAKALFGDGFQFVMNHVAELQRLQYTRDKALAEEQANFKTRQQEQIANQQKQKEFVEKAWRDVNTDLAEKNPEYFQPDPQDKQRAEVFNKSLSLIDSRHNGKALTPIQHVTLDAQIRLRAAAYPVLQYDLAKAKARIAELEGIKADQEDSDPATGSTRRPATNAGGQSPEKGWKDSLNELG